MFISYHSHFSVQNASELPKAAPKAQGNIKIRSKNYASPDCGAKIVGANPEAQHASAVLSSSQDEYALSPCNSAKIWFVVELCEAIQAKQVTTRLPLMTACSLIFISSRFCRLSWPTTSYSRRLLRSFQCLSVTDTRRGTGTLSANLLHRTSAQCRASIWSLFSHSGNSSRLVPRAFVVLPLSYPGDSINACALITFMAPGKI